MAKRAEEVRSYGEDKVMNAVISGRAGLALLIEGESMMSLDVDDLETLVPRSPNDLRFLLADADDLITLENTRREEVAQRLDLEHDIACALDMTLIALDSGASMELRAEAVAALDELLADARVIERLEFTMYATPLPGSADLMGALFCTEVTTAAARSFFERLDRDQAAIRSVREAWDALPDKFFGNEADRAVFHWTACNEGLFRLLALSYGDPAKGSGFLIDALKNRSIASLRNYREVIQQWSAPIRAAAGPNAPFESEYEGEYEEPAEIQHHSTGRDKRRRREPADLVLKKVDGQKELIVAAIRARDLTRAREILEELIEYQLKTSRPEHLAMSLCALAIKAKDLGNQTLRLEMTTRSVEIRPDDGWAWVQHGDALREGGRFDEAAYAYAQAEIFRGVPVAETGRAELLRVTGKLEDALRVYEEAVAAHPENVVAKNGRAEVLKAQGKLIEAEEAFDEVIAAHPEDVVAKTGRAEVLKRQGRLSAALDAYKEILASRPNDLVARNARSCILAALGRYSEALRDLPTENPGSEEDWIGYHIRGMTLLRMGDVEAASRVFELGKGFCPWGSPKGRFIASLALARIRSRQFGPAREILDQVTMPAFQPHVQVLQIHALGELNEFDRASEVYTDLMANPRPFSDELPDELRSRYVVREGRFHDDSWVDTREADMFLLY